MTTGRPVIDTCILVALIMFGPASQSGEILELLATEADGAYQLRMVAVLDAPEEYVYQVISDYKYAYRISPAITSVELLSSDLDGTVRVHNYSQHQIGLFSFEVEWVGDIVQTEHRRIDITTISETGSFESGTAQWQLRPQGDRTWVLHESSLTPNFYIFPVIGNYLLKKHMETETLATLNRIECHAQILLEADLEQDPVLLNAVLNEKQECIHLH